MADQELPDIEPVKLRAAERLGVTVRTITTWQKEAGFPNFEAGYDIPKIKVWAEARGRKNSQHDNRLKAIEEKLKSERLRREQLNADKLAREEAIATGNVLLRDEFEQFCAEQITIARDRLKLIPRNMCKYIPKKYHKTLMHEGEKEVQKILDQLAREFEDAKTR